MKWIKSRGGPLICIERRLAYLWRGTEKVSQSNAKSSIGMATDYERACQIQGYLGIVGVPGGFSLVLGDMPLETSIWTKGTGNIFIVRLFYIDPDVDIGELIVKISDSQFNDTGEAPSIKIESSPMIVFDSAIPGNNQTEKNISFQITTGTYKILTEVFNPNNRTSLLLHKFCLMM